MTRIAILIDLRENVVSFNNRRKRFVKAVILAGGLGTRTSEETSVKPKLMVEIGGRPILWHLMKLHPASIRLP